MEKLGPLHKAKVEISTALYSYLKQSLESVSFDDLLNSIEIPREELGDIAFPLHRILRGKEIKLELKSDYIESYNLINNYLNIRINIEKLSYDLFQETRNEDYGYVKAEKGMRVVVEHTSANPVHPLHIGHVRNSILGDSISRILKYRGHLVQTRFYVNDMGRQVGVLVYGVDKLGNAEPPRNYKSDEWYGLVYAITNTIIEIKNKTEKLKEEPDNKEILSERDDLLAIANELRERDKELFDKLADEIMKDEDPEGKVNALMKLYEENNKEVVGKVRRVVEKVLDGFMESLNRIKVSFDKWDFESDLVFSGSVKELIELARNSPLFGIYKGAPSLIFDDFLNEELRRELKIEEIEIPPLILMRSDGTTLYPTRDLAYTLKKFREFNADRVINVIASEQSLPQSQLRLSLAALGFIKEARNLIHYSYAMVQLPGTKMSGRKGKYISLDYLVSRIEDEVRRKMEGREVRGDKEKNIRELTNAALRYLILCASPRKPLTISIKSATDFESNSGPYLIYTHARASSIIKKHGFIPDANKSNLKTLNEGDKRRIVIMTSMFPEIFVKTAEEMKTEILVNYLRDLADSFNSWYDKERIIQEQDEDTRNAKVLLTNAVRKVLKNGLNAIGIEPLEEL